MIEYYNAIKGMTTLSPNNVMEIGSRDGHDANALAKMFEVKDEDVFIIEPHPKSFKKIREIYGKYHIYEVAISSETGVHSFTALEEDVGISSLLDRNDGFYDNKRKNIIDVKTLTGRDFLNRDELKNKKIDICKIDVEGMTYEVLQSFDSEIERFNSFHIETENYEVWKGQKTSKEVFKFLYERGYVKIYEYKIGEVQLDTIWIKEGYIK
tara:strand:+ start:33 stop:662 length:630 start_codon:yes stop_codon:yes gene_type:complete